MKKQGTTTIFEYQNVEPLIMRIARMPGIELVKIVEDQSEIQIEFTEGVRQDVYIDSDPYYRPGNQAIHIYGSDPNTREAVAEVVRDFLKDAENLRPGHGGSRQTRRSRVSSSSSRK